MLSLTILVSSLSYQSLVWAIQSLFDYREHTKFLYVKIHGP